jgi:hypothetical protein
MVSRIGRRKFLATLGGEAVAYLAGRGARAAAGKADDWTQYSGFWTFRVFDPTYVTSNQTPENEWALIRADAEINFQTTPPRIQWDDGRSGLVLDPVTVKPGVVGEPASYYSVGTPDPPGWQPVSFYSVGTGPPNTDTAGWEYDYYGHLTRNWPNTDPKVQRPLLVGSVFRAKSHNGAPPRSPAGEVFSFIAVKQQPPPFTRELSGLWTYRSFLNDPKRLYATAPPTVPELILQEALVKLETPTSTTLQGGIEWLSGGGDFLLDLRGWIQPGVGDEPSPFGMVGTGRPGTNTEGREYYYEGHLTRNWPNGINQVPALVGSLIRGKPNPESPGRSLPFIAVMQPQ